MEIFFQLNKSRHWGKHEPGNDYSWLWVFPSWFSGSDSFAWICYRILAALGKDYFQILRLNCARAPLSLRNVEVLHGYGKIIENGGRKKSCDLKCCQQRVKSVSVTQGRSSDDNVILTWRFLKKSLSKIKNAKAFFTVWSMAPFSLYFPTFQTPLWKIRTICENYASHFVLGATQKQSWSVTSHTP